MQRVGIVYRDNTPAAEELARSLLAQLRLLISVPGRSELRTGAPTPERRNTTTSSSSSAATAPSFPPRASAPATPPPCLASILGTSAFWRNSNPTPSRRNCPSILPATIGWMSDPCLAAHYCIITSAPSCFHSTISSWCGAHNHASCVYASGSMARSIRHIPPMASSSLPPPALPPITSPLVVPSCIRVSGAAC